MTNGLSQSKYDFESIDFYVSGIEEEANDWLLKNEPVHYFEPLDTWFISKYEDIREVGKFPEIYSNTGALTLNMIRLLVDGNGNALDKYFASGSEFMITLDPPRHKTVKRVLTPSFNPRAVRRLEDDLRRISNDLLDRIVPGEPIDVVSKIAAPFSIMVAIRILGLKDQDLDQVQGWVEALEDLVKVSTVAELESAAEVFATMGPMLAAEMERKRSEPGNDLYTVLLNTELDGEPIRPEAVLANVGTFISNGGTTRSLVANMLDKLSLHPDQRQLLVEDQSLIIGAMEETLRFKPSARGFSRLVLRDTELGGQTIKAGQYVYVNYAAANRDEEIFDDPNRFDITRDTKNTHLSFGFGTHSCLGQALVRLEIKILMGELLKRYTTWSRTAEDPVPHAHPQLNGWSKLFLTFN
ncbi:cytochrome P450 [Rhodococcus globerulus]|uniref:Cytochrome P450 n=1 Tax=Rhodococcus globerulus TaxID=33008 RepID=A0ABU4C2Y5_RHOGO|nr:cytochrome P450 [Rhodococcus globerulus]MDV6270862.1 cytochrome P450 [Rhodococcus globerulus]